MRVFCAESQDYKLESERHGTQGMEGQDENHDGEDEE